MVEPLKIIIDTREQTPWAWDASQAITRIGTLAAGDYALEGDCEPMQGRKSYAVRFAIERKSLDDFLGTISTGWERFQRELVRMESFPARVVIVEGDFVSVCFREECGAIIPPEHQHQRLTPSFVSRRIAELTMMGVSVLFAGGADYAAALAFRIFKRRDEICRF
jgi:ERCC4-type nuclease